MGFHGGNWYSFIRYDEEQDRPTLSGGLIRRVAEFARPYWRWVSAILITIIGVSALSLLPPLLIRDLLDTAIPERDSSRLNLLALGMIGVPLINGLLGVVQRYASATVGEGIIFDLRSAVYAHLQRMSLRFYTNTHAGELISRLNNDVIGAQRAVTGTLVTLVSDSFSLIATLAIMVALDWRLTLLSIAILPLFIMPARRIGEALRRIARQQMESNARMNALMNETLNISGALLVKIFGRYGTEVDRFKERASEVRSIGVRQAIIGRWFFLALSLVSAIGTALVFWVGGHLTLQGAFTIGTLVAFTGYLRNLYGPLMALTNARVDFRRSGGVRGGLLQLPGRGDGRAGRSTALKLERARYVCAARQEARCRAQAGFPHGREAGDSSMGTEGREFRNQARAGRCAGRPEWRRKINHHLSAAAALRSNRGNDHAGWSRLAGYRAG
jgi:ATP-binding cassette subfamily B protein